MNQTVVTKFDVVETTMSPEVEEYSTTQMIQQQSYTDQVHILLYRVHRLYSIQYRLWLIQSSQTFIKMTSNVLLYMNFGTGHYVFKSLFKSKLK